MNVSSCGCRSYRSCTSPCPPPLPDLLLKSERLVQVTRITGALSINIAPNFVNAQQVLAAKAIIERVNTEFNRTPEAKLTLVSYPYSENSGYLRPNRYPLPDPQCGCNSGPPLCIDDPRQECHDQEAVDAYLAAIALVRGLVPDSMIGRQFFDTERWNTRFGQTEWNRAITRKHNLFHTKGKEKLPGARIHQYERGSITLVDLPLSHGHNPVPSNYYALDELGESFDVSLYMAPDFDRMRAMLNATAQVASAHAGENEVSEAFVTPWVGLAYGKRDFAGAEEPYEADWDYGVRAARDLALMLRYFSTSASLNPPVTINTIGLYPEPFSRLTPHWVRYFIEYVRAFTQ